MSRPAADRIPRLHPQTRYRVVGGQAVVIVQDAGEALVLNEIGSRILERIDGKRTVADLVALVDADYEADSEEIARDVGEYLEELAAAGILEVGGGVTATDPDRR